MLLKHGLLGICMQLRVGPWLRYPSWCVQGFEQVGNMNAHVHGFPKCAIALKCNIHSTDVSFRDSRARSN